MARRLKVRAAALAAAFLLAPLTPACRSSARADDLAAQACTHVAAGIADYEKESPALAAAQNAHLDDLALTELTKALPLAAQAAENSGQWNALMVNLQEINRVPLSYLVGALSGQCSAILGRPVGTTVGSPAGGPVSTAPPGVAH